VFIELYIVYDQRMSRENVVAVVGAGLIGSAVAFALAREGRRVLLVDRAEPGTGGASFGNVGHIAAELVEPLPSRALLFGFWHELFVFGGPLDVPLRRMPQFLPWARHFAAAAGHRQENTRYLAPLVRPATLDMSRWLAEIGCSDLLRTNGHYEVWLGERSSRRAATQALVMEKLGIATQPAPDELLRTIAGQAAIEITAGLWYPSTGHVLDPLKIMQSFVGAAIQRGATFKRAEVSRIQALEGGVTLQTSSETLSVNSVVVCTGAWSTSLLESLGLRVPMESARGYHVELPNHRPLTDAPILYSDSHIVITPMQGRLRASGFMEFTDSDASPDARKPAHLRRALRHLGYHCPPEGPSWVGPRPVLPDYLPGIGRVGQSNVFYAIGHQHIGLTLAPVTGDLVADLVAGRKPRHDVSAFDLRRFQ
jgi:D-amino-acid dehydrogenase